MKKVHYYLLLSIIAVVLTSCNSSNAKNNENNNSKNEINMKFEKVALPYATDALEPVISKQTVELHYGKH
ncbi:MAG: superoxide dismutase, partial [Fermentimonas sp.]